MKPIDVALSRVDWKPIERDHVQHMGGLPIATHRGVLKISGAEIECFQLDNGKRVISEKGLLDFFSFLEGESEPKK